MTPSRLMAVAPRGNLVNRRLLLSCLALLSVLVGPSKITRAAGSNEAALAHALGVLRKEKSAAEQYAQLLGNVEKSDPAVYRRGIEYYIDAKAEFDGLIEELKVGLIEGQDLARSAKFSAALHESAEKQFAFTTYVKREVSDKRKGARAGLPDVANVVTEVLQHVTNAALSIWKVYIEQDEQRRAAILKELDSVEWKPISELIKK